MNSKVVDRNRFFRITYKYNHKIIIVPIDSIFQTGVTCLQCTAGYNKYAFAEWQLSSSAPRDLNAQCSTWR